MPSLTTQILIEIRDAVRVTNERLDATRTELSLRLDATNERLEATNESLNTLARRQTETELRLATELVGVSSAVKKLTQAYRKSEALTGDVNDLKRRVDAIERKQA